MSNKLVNNKNKEQNEDKKITSLDKESKLILGILGTALIGLFVFIIYWGYSGVIAEKEYYETMFEVVAPDFESLEAAASAEEAPTDKTEGTIGFDAFYELRREKAKESLNKIKGVLGDELYVEYLNGLDTEYYKKSVEYDYNDMLNDMDEILKEAGIIEALYNLYADTSEMPEYTECFDEDCSLLEFIENYTRDDLHDYLKTRHDMWESVIEVEASRTNVSDSYLNLFYQDKICADLSYVDNISVEVILLNDYIYNLGFETIQEAYDTGYLKSKIITEETKNYLENFSLYKDIDFYDDGFRDLAVDAFQAQFANDVVQESVYLGQIGTASDANEELKNKLIEMGAPESDEEVIDYTKIENWNVESLSLGARNEEDVIYMLWKVVPGSVKHTDNIPSMDSLMDEIKHDATYYMASRTISDTIYAELNNLTEDEVHDLLKENYGYTDEELDELTEEEMRESLLKEQEKEEQEAQENLAEIKTHMEEHGYDLTGMTDEEIIEYYINTHEEALESQTTE